MTLTIEDNGQNCTASKPTLVVEPPAAFHMTGGGAIIQGAGVEVGLSGSQASVIYKLRREGQYTGVAVIGTGQAISFGPQTVPGNYTAVARVDGSDCLLEMEGVAVVTQNLPPVTPLICMVTFDTAMNKNKVIWNKITGEHLSHYNIYRETYQGNHFTKVGEVPASSFSVFPDPVADPLVKSDRYRISLSDTAGSESEKSPVHKTIHLNINAGISGFNLIWNHYEGFEFLTYRIHRKHAGGAWEPIDSVASNVDSYTDFYTTSGITTYYIEVVRPEPCNPSDDAGGYAGVISNTASAAPLGMVEDPATGVLFYPNPVKEKLSVVMSGRAAFNVDIVRLDGVILRSIRTSGPRAVIDVSGLVKGMYILKVYADGSVTVRKVVKN